jgi:PAS domain S-box-containing protein
MRAPVARGDRNSVRDTVRAEPIAGDGHTGLRPTPPTVEPVPRGANVLGSSLLSPQVRDALTTIYQRTVELIVRGASLEAVLNTLCDGIDALDPDLISTVLLADPDGQRLWPKAGPRVPDAWKRLITPLPIAACMGSCGTAAFRKKPVINPDIANDPLWCDPVLEKYRTMALEQGLRTAWSVPLLSDTGELLGTYGMYYTKPKPVGAEDLELLQKAGYIALIAIERDRAQTALTDALAEVRKSEAELRTIVDMIPQLVAVLDAGGDVLYVNQSTLQYTGVSPDQAKGIQFRQQVFHPEDEERQRDTRRHALERGAQFENEQRARRHDGQYRWFLVQYRPLRDDRGHVVRWYATATDIDDRKQAEERIRNENLALREEIDRSSMFEEIVGTSRALQPVLARVAKVARTDSTVLITGETGTGKELVARAIHRRSARASRAFVSVNCAAIPRELIASELFGHEKGAFTGATQRRPGRFELAHGGTIFLDEVGDLPMETQVVLLRVLQEREFERIGGTASVRVDVRVIAATNRDLQEAIEAGTFRSDLFYRLNVFPIAVPALRERVDDISLLVGYFIDRYARKAGKTIRGVSQRTLEHLRAYPWPGNVRELQNVIERSVIVCDTDEFAVDESWLSTAPEPEKRPALARTVAGHERRIIEEALRASGGRIYGPSGAAARLGIARSTLESKVQVLGIDKNRFRSRRAKP